MEYVILYLAVNIVLGALACFCGKKLFYLLLGALVFLAVLNAGLSATDASAASVAVAVVLGIVAALLSKLAYKAGVFIVGFVAGACLGYLGAVLVLQDGGPLPAIALVVGVLSGLAALRWADFFVRAGTAWAGASFVVPNALAAVTSFEALASHAVSGDGAASFEAVSAFVSGDFAAANATTILVGTVALAIVGALVQARED